MRIVIALALLASCHHLDQHAGLPPLTEATVAVPIAPGQTEAWRAAIVELTGPRYAEYEASRRRFGLTSQTTFLQHTPMGDFAVIHMTGADVRRSFHAMSESQDPWDVKWRQLTQSLHGFDFASGERVMPELEPLFQTGSGGTGKPFAFLAPLTPDGADHLRAIAPDLMGDRHADYVRAREAAGVHREAAFLETSAQGTAIVFFWLADDPAASLAKLSTSTDPFDIWLRDQARTAHPIPLASIAEIAAGNTLVGQYPH